MPAEAATAVQDPPSDPQGQGDSLEDVGFDTVLDRNFKSGEDHFPDDFQGLEDADADPPEAGDRDTEGDEPPPRSETDDTDTDTQGEDADEEYIPSDDADDWFDDDYPKDEDEGEVEDEADTEEEEEEEEAEVEDELEDADEDTDEDEERFDDAKPFTKKDRDVIDKSPELQRAYKSMQGRYSTRSAEVATERRAIRAEAEEIRGFKEQLRDPQGMANVMTRVMNQRPDIVGAAFQGALTGKQKEAVLLATAVADPDTFKKVYERNTELQEDPQEMEFYNRNKDLRAQRRKNAQRERELNRRDYRRNRARIETSATRTARNLRIKKADMRFVMDDLQAALRGKIRKNGSIDFSDREIKSSVRATKKRLNEVYRTIEARERRKTARASQKKTKTRAKKAKAQRRAPKGPTQRSASRPPARPKKSPAPKNQRERDAIFDRELDRGVRRIG